MIPQLSSDVSNQVVNVINSVLGFVAILKELAPRAIIVAFKVLEKDHLYPILEGIAVALFRAVDVVKPFVSPLVIGNDETTISKLLTIGNHQGL